MRIYAILIMIMLVGCGSVGDSGTSLDVCLDMNTVEGAPCDSIQGKAMMAPVFLQEVYTFDAGSINKDNTAYGVLQIRHTEPADLVMHMVMPIYINGCGALGIIKIDRTLPTGILVTESLGGTWCSNALIGHQFCEVYIYNGPAGSLPDAWTGDPLKPWDWSMVNAMYGTPLAKARVNWTYY